MENIDLCKICKHYWQDFPMPFDMVISHCEELDKKPHKGEMDEIVPYPCTKCPFDAYLPRETKKILKNHERYCREQPIIRN